MIPVTAAWAARPYINAVARTSLVTPWLTKLGDEVVDGSQAATASFFFNPDRYARPIVVL